MIPRQIPSGTPIIHGTKRIERTAQQSSHWFPWLGAGLGVLLGAGAYPEDDVDPHVSSGGGAARGVTVDALVVSTKLPQLEQ